VKIKGFGRKNKQSADIDYSSLAQKSAFSSVDTAAKPWYAKLNPFRRPRITRRSVMGGVLIIVLIAVGGYAYYRMFIDENRVVVQVGEQNISAKDINERKDALDGAHKFFDTKMSEAEAMDRAQDSLIMHAALSKEAEARGIVVDDKDVQRQFAENANKHKLSPDDFTKLMHETYGFTRDDLELNYRIQILQARLHSELIAYKDILRIRVRYDMIKDGEKSKENEVKQVLEQKFLPLLKARASTKDIIAKTDVNERNPSGDAKVTYPVIGKLEYGLNQQAKPDFFQDSTEWQVIDELREVGDYTADVKRSGGGYFYLYRLENKSKGQYANWQDFLEKTKDQVSFKGIPGFSRKVASITGSLFGAHVSAAPGVCSVDMSMQKHDGLITRAFKQVFGLQKAVAQQCSGTSSNHLTGWSGVVTTTGGVTADGVQVYVAPRSGQQLEGWEYCGGSSTATVYTGGVWGGYNTGMSFSCFMQWQATFSKANCTPVTANLPLLTGDNGSFASLNVNVTLPCTAPPPPPPPTPNPTDTPYCSSISASKRPSADDAYTVSWSFGGLSSPKNGSYDASLYGSSSGNTVNNVGTSGSRDVRVGSGSTYTVTLYDGWLATSVKCVITVIPGQTPTPETPDPPVCNQWDYYGMGICCDTNPHPYYCYPPPPPPPPPYVRCEVRGGQGIQAYRSAAQPTGYVQSGSEFTLQWNAHWVIDGRIQRTNTWSGQATFNDLTRQFGGSSSVDMPGSKTITAPDLSDWFASRRNPTDTYDVRINVNLPAEVGGGWCPYTVKIYNPTLTLPSCTDLSGKFEYNVRSSRSTEWLEVTNYPSFGYKNGSYETRPTRVDGSIQFERYREPQYSWQSATVTQENAFNVYYQDPRDPGRGRPYETWGRPWEATIIAPGEDHEQPLSQRVPGSYDMYPKVSARGRTYTHVFTASPDTIDKVVQNIYLPDGYWTGGNITEITWTYRGIMPGGGNLTCSSSVDPESPPPTPFTGPYHKVYGGDVTVGGGFGDICEVDASATILGSNKLSGGNYVGAGTQLAAMALGVINGFGSSQSNTTAKTKQLTLANTEDANAYGGNLNPLHKTCAPDFWVGQRTATEKTASSLSIATLDAGANQHEGNVTFTGGNLALGQRKTLYVEGNVRITGNITYNLDSPYTSIKSIPSFRLIVKGNIYVDPDVTELNGVFVAMPNGTDDTTASGRFYTCSPAMRAPNAGELASCNNLLTVYGSVLADLIKFTRTRGTVDNATTGERYNNNLGSPAEKFIYTPETWLTSDFGGIGDNDAFVTLPPVL
jgi:hypothetical protein